MKIKRMFEYYDAVNVPKQLRKPTEEELEKFREHLQEVVKKYYRRPSNADYVLIEDEPVFWHDYAAALEFTLKDLSMEGVVIYIEGNYDWGRARNDKLYVALINGRMVKVMGNTLSLNHRDTVLGWLYDESFLRYTLCGPDFDKGLPSFWRVVH